MARYIDADALAKNGWHLERSGISNVTLQTMSLADVPTADVVPKSEVERLIGKFECFLCHATGGRLSKYTYDLGTMESVATDCINETYNDGYGEGYKDCARGILAELETKAPFFCENQIAYEHFNEELAELKKRNTWRCK